MGREVRLNRRKGRQVMRSGYIRIWAPDHPTASADGYALEHRMVAFDAGLLSDLRLHVHHRNEVKADNRIENLEVMTESEHHRMHVAAVGFITNQHGTFRVLTGEAKTERDRERARLAQRIRRAAAKAAR